MMLIYGLLLAVLLYVAGMVVFIIRRINGDGIDPRDVDER